jgi:hypothetical protein
MGRFSILIHGREYTIPLYMDIHRNVDGLTADSVAGAHARAIEIQKHHGVNYSRHWYNEGEGAVFCLVDAPNREAAERVHGEAHGLVADETIEVKEGR